MKTLDRISCHTSSFEKNILFAIEECRFVVLRTIEFEMEHSPHWPTVRSRVLKAFGEKGLSGYVRELINSLEKIDQEAGQ